MQALPCGRPDASPCGLVWELAQLAREVQSRISSSLGTHCSTLRDAAFRLRKGRRVSSSLAKQLAQLNSASSRLRHYTTPWADNLLDSIDRARRLESEPLVDEVFEDCSEDLGAEASRDEPAGTLGAGMDSVDGTAALRIMLGAAVARVNARLRAADLAVVNARKNIMLFKKNLTGAVLSGRDGHGLEPVPRGEG